MWARAVAQPQFHLGGELGGVAGAGGVQDGHCVVNGALKDGRRSGFKRSAKVV
jgi:hypothetical protein